MVFLLTGEDALLGGSVAPSVVLTAVGVPLFVARIRGVQRVLARGSAVEATVAEASSVLPSRRRLVADYTVDGRSSQWRVHLDPRFLTSVHVGSKLVSSSTPRRRTEPSPSTSTVLSIRERAWATAYVNWRGRPGRSWRRWPCPSSADSCRSPDRESGAAGRGPGVVQRGQQPDQRILVLHREVTVPGRLDQPVIGLDCAALRPRTGDEEGLCDRLVGAHT